MAVEGAAVRSANKSSRDSPVAPERALGGVQLENPLLDRALGHQRQLDPRLLPSVVLRTIDAESVSKVSTAG